MKAGYNCTAIMYRTPNSTPASLYDDANFRFHGQRVRCTEYSMRQTNSRILNTTHSD